MNLKRFGFCFVTLISIGLPFCLNANKVFNTIKNATAIQASVQANFTYELDPNNNTYTITGISNKDQAESANIPITYQNKRVAKIAANAFNNANSLTQIDFNGSLDSIGDYAFSNLPNLTSVNLSRLLFNSKTQKVIGEGVLADCPKLSSVILPTSNEFSLISPKMFKNDKALGELTFSSNIQYVDDEAFNNAHIQVLTVSDRETWLDYDSNHPMWGCIVDHLKFSNLIFTHDPVDLWAYHDENIFYGCKLKYVELIDDEELAEDEGFEAHYTYDDQHHVIGGYFAHKDEVDGYNDVTGLAFGKIHLRDHYYRFFHEEYPAFMACWSLEEMTVDRNVAWERKGPEYHGILDGATSLKALHLLYTAEDFNDSRLELKQLFSPNFYNAVLPVVIHHDASVDFNTIKNIYAQNFGNEKIVYLDGNVDYDNTWSVAFKDGGGRGYIKPIDINKMADHITIPETVNDISGQPIPIWGIYKDAFRGASKLTSISLPESVGDISVSAFQDCPNLETVDFPNEIVSIRHDAFRHCPKLNHLSFGDSVLNISDRAFADCDSLSDVRFKDIYNIREIGNEVFARCNSLKTFSFGSNKRSGSTPRLGYGVFQDCKNLTNVELPYFIVGGIGQNMFTNTKLKSITFPISIGNDLSIGQNAFKGCSELTTVNFNKIDKQQIQINPNAFDGCENLFNINLTSDWIDDADYQVRASQTQRIKELYKSLNNVPPIDQISFTNWFDQSTDSITGSIYNFVNPTKINTSFGEGYKNFFSLWPKATVSVHIDENPYLDIQASLDLTNNDPSKRINLNARVKSLNFNTYTTDLNWYLTVDIKREFIVNLTPIHIELNQNKDLSFNTPIFTSNQSYPRSENGLWAGGDYYTIGLMANKIYFGQNWNNVENIKANLNNYFTLSDPNNQPITLTKVGTSNVFFNNTVGNVEIINITPNSEQTYLIKLKISIPLEYQDIHLVDQTIKVNLTNQDDKEQKFAEFKTFNGFHFDPKIKTIYQQVNPINIGLETISDNVTWNLAHQTDFSYLPTNTFAYYQNHNYRFSINLNGFSHQNFSIDPNIKLSANATSFSTKVNLTNQPLNDVNNVNVNSLRLQVKNDNDAVVLDLPLPSFIVNITGVINDQYVVKQPELVKNPEILNDRDGLWATGDYYHTILKINKVIFQGHEQDAKYIQKHFDQFITMQGNDETYNWGERAILSNNYFNPFIGQLTVNSITSIDPYHYQIDLTFTKPIGCHVSYKTQEITFKFTATKKELFKIKTINANDLDVHYYPLEKNFDLIKLNHDHRSQHMVYHTKDHPEFSDLVGNTFKWAKLKGYRFEIDSSNFSNKYLSIDKVASFNPNNNTLSFGVNQILASLTEQKDILVDGLVLKIIDNHNNTYQTINLKYFKVEIAKAYSDVNATQPVYNGSNHTSLNNNGDYSEFDLLIPSVLIPANGDRELINSINIHYENEKTNNWKWNFIRYSDGTYLFNTFINNKEFQLTYQRISESGHKINKIITYHFTLTKLFDGDKKKDIYLNIKNADFGTVHIENDQYKEPEIDPHPALTTFIKWLPVIGGTLGGIGFISLIGYFIYRHNRFKNYVIHEYRDKRPKKRR